jgi:hypothetical protein
MPKSLATSPRGAASIGTEAYQGSASLIVANHGKLTHSDANITPSEEVQDVKASDEVTALRPGLGSPGMATRRQEAVESDVDAAVQGPAPHPQGSTDPCLPELPCTPRRCELGSIRHEHCVCGLPMAVGARCCRLCVKEGLDLDQVVRGDDGDLWDGTSRPSRRRRPKPGPNPLGYVVLLSAILDPGAWDGGIAQRWARSRSWAA